MKANHWEQVSQKGKTSCEFLIIPLFQRCPIANVRAFHKENEGCLHYLMKANEMIL